MRHYARLQARAQHSSWDVITVQVSGAPSHICSLMDGRSYVSEGCSIAVLALITGVLYQLASSTSVSVCRWFFYWAVAGGTSSLLVASSSSIMPNQGLPQRISTIAYSGASQKAWTVFVPPP